MPKVTSTEKLIELIKRSELIGKDELADFLATRAAKSKGLLPPDHHTLANELIGSISFSVEVTFGMPSQSPPAGRRNGFIENLLQVIET